DDARRRLFDSLRSQSSLTEISTNAGRHCIWFEPQIAWATVTTTGQELVREGVDRGRIARLTQRIRLTTAESERTAATGTATVAGVSKVAMKDIQPEEEAASVPIPMNGPWLALLFDEPPAGQRFVCWPEKKVLDLVWGHAHGSGQLPKYFGVSVDFAGRTVVIGMSK